MFINVYCLSSLHNHYSKLKNSKQIGDVNWFDQNIFIFKHLFHNSKSKRSLVLNGGRSSGSSTLLKKEAIKGNVCDNSSRFIQRIYYWKQSTLFETSSCEDLRLVKVKKVLQTWFANFSSNKGSQKLKPISLVVILWNINISLQYSGEIVETKFKDPLWRLTHLIKFTDGEGKDLIKHCIHLPPEIGYDTAKTLLNKSYDNPHSLLASYRKEIKSLAPIVPSEVMDFRKFHNFVLKCETLSKITSWNSLETSELSFG